MEGEEQEEDDDDDECGMRHPPLDNNRRGQWSHLTGQTGSFRSGRDALACLLVFSGEICCR